ncbi:hypothetical protein HZS_2643 [Henneguya salminicola]|nr:hypothetical protein HZS_2643 [Henneguya salminicola]
MRYKTINLKPMLKQDFFYKPIIFRAIFFPIFILIYCIFIYNIFLIFLLLALSVIRILKFPDQHHPHLVGKIEKF